jgi:hypothetical protein
MMQFDQKSVSVQLLHHHFGAAGTGGAVRDLPT